VEEVAEWFIDLTKNDPASADLVEDAIDRLAVAGPSLRRAVLVVAGTSRATGEVGMRKLSR